MVNKVKTKVMTVGLAACLLLAGLFGLAWTNRKNVVTADALTIQKGGWATLFDFINPGGPYPYIVIVEYEAVGEDALNYSSFDALCAVNPCFREFLDEAVKNGFPAGSAIFKAINLIMFIEVNGPNSPDFIYANSWSSMNFVDENQQANLFSTAWPQGYFMAMFANGQKVNGHYVYNLMLILEQNNLQTRGFSLK